MTFNRVTRRLLTRLQKADRPQVLDITEPVHILAQSGLIEYEEYQGCPDMVLAWAVPRTGEVDAEPKYVADEYSWLSSRKQKPTKEQTMAKVSIDVQNITLGGNIVVGSAIISVEVPDDAFATMATMYERCLPLIFGRAVHVCKCEASNGDKRPGTAATYHDRGKERGTPAKANAFAPEVD